MAEMKHGHAPPTNGNTAGGSQYSIDLNTFSRRLEALYSHWRDHRDALWGSSDVLSISTAPPEDLCYLKSSAMNWLLGYEFPETIMVFGTKQIHFLCSQKKALLLDVVKKSAKAAVGVDVVMHVKGKSDDGTALMDSVLLAVGNEARSDGHDAPVVGYIARERPEGKLLKTWANKLKNSGLQLGDITAGLSDIFAVKDQEEDSESEDDDSDSESLVESEDDEEEDSELDSEEDKGKTWDELEREASSRSMKGGDEERRRLERGGLVLGVLHPSDPSSARRLFC